MAFQYILDVTTGPMLDAGTYDNVYATLIGTDGESEKTKLSTFGPNFIFGTRTYTIDTNCFLGDILLLRLEKDKHRFLPDKQWFCSKIWVTTPQGGKILFPCYRWISHGEVVELEGGNAKRSTEQTPPLLVQHRIEELKKRKETFQWEEVVKGICHMSNFNDPSQIPDELKFSDLRLLDLDTVKSAVTSLVDYVTPGKEWKDFDDMKPLFPTVMSAYVAENWKNDEFFGYQILNGINPNVIKKCNELPDKFPVTDDMVKSSLEGKSLKDEMKNGNIFLCDQKMMHGINSRKYNEDVELKMTAALCLFYLKPTDKLIPIAIQLYQEPSETNPIFLPSDREEDWLLAKIFFKNGHLVQHEAIYHLLTTHFLEESFAVATFRNLPAIHPIYKLLIPHFRYTMHVNTIGRTLLLGPTGIFNQSTTGICGTQALMANGFSEMTKSAMKPETSCKYFVRKVVMHYYGTDRDVAGDRELQHWIKEIFTNSFLSKPGFPESFDQVEHVVKFITMIIFTSTAQHAAVNNGQADFILFIANAPLLVRKSPPTTKGQSSKSTILTTLPNKSEATEFQNLARLLSGKYSDIVMVGEMPKERFQEEIVSVFIEQFQEDLSNLSDIINKRTPNPFPPYTYMNPAQTENSITI